MKTIIYMTLVSLLFVSCEKIVAEDISNDLPVVILPTQNDTVQSNPVHFKWEEMEGATKYHLQVVSPSFTSINEYSIDSIIEGTNFFISLDSNEYEMKLTALNAGYESLTIGPIKFWVGVQPSSSSGNVLLSTPDDMEYVNGAFDGQFSWSSLTSATSYEFSLRQGTNFSTGTVLDAQNGISTLTYSSGIVFTEGVYSWGVKAYLNGGTETIYSTRKLYVDLTDPNTAVLTVPADFSLQSQGVIPFTWSNGTDPGTVHAPVNSFIEIATDTGFTNVVQSQSVQSNTVDITLGAGTYYWRVTNTDDAGNTTPSISTFQFSVL